MEIVAFKLTGSTVARHVVTLTLDFKLMSILKIVDDFIDMLTGFECIFRLNSAFFIRYEVSCTTLQLLCHNV